MKTFDYLVGDVLQLVRRPVAIDADKTYAQIGIRSFGRGVFHKPPVSGGEIGGKRLFQIEPGDLILSNVFAWEGAVAVASAAEAGMVGSHRFMTYQVDQEVADARYLYFYFTSERGLEAIRRSSPGSAGRNKTLGIKSFASQRISIPNLVEQQRIAARLHSTMLTLDQIQQSHHHTGKYIQYLRHSLLSAISATRCLGDVLKLSPAQVNVIPENTYEIAGIYSFGRGLIRRPPITGSQTSYKSFTPLKTGQVVMSKLNAWEGALAVVDDQFSGSYVSGEYPVFDVDATAAIPNYVKHLIAWPNLWLQLMPRGSMVRRKRTHPNVLLSLHVPMPDVPAQIEISRQLDQISSVENLRTRQNQIIGALRGASVNAALYGHP